jgi:hypothetical protein
MDNTGDESEDIASPPLLKSASSDWSQPPVPIVPPGKRSFGPLDLDPGQNWFQAKVMVITIVATIGVFFLANITGDRLGNLILGFATGLLAGLVVAGIAVQFRRRR